MSQKSLRTPSRRTLGGLALLAAGAAAATWFLAGQPAAETTLKPVANGSKERPVLVRKVVLEPVAQPRLLVGTVRARIEADHGFRISGKVASRLVQIGDRVKKGATLALLDTTDLALQRQSAEAERNASIAAERNAAAELARITELRQRGWSTEQALDRQKAAVEEATGRRLRAERNAELASNTQSYAELRAETDGIVISAQAEPGQVIAAGQPIIRLAQDGDREAQVAVPEQQVGELARLKAEAALWTDAGRPMPARLRELSPSADPATRTFQARFTIPDLAIDAPLGMTVTVSLAEPEQRRLARIPLSALINEGAGPEVFIVNPQTSELVRRKVELAAIQARDAVLRAGLQEGDIIVVLGVHKLKSGQKVTPITEIRLG